MRARGLVWKAFFLACLVGIVLLGIGYSNATSEPTLRRAEVKVSTWPEGAPEYRILALSDVHIAGPDMPPERFVRLAKQFNELNPDLIIITGDLISEKRVATHIYSAVEIAAALAKLEARHGVIVVPGNHDHWAGMAELKAALLSEGITVLANESVALDRLNLTAIDDMYSDHDDVEAAFASLGRLARAPTVVISHSPDVIPELPYKVDAVFAGHTHCGQISLPILGPVTYMSRYGDRFSCGDITDNGQRIFVGAGLGTSLLPLRYGVPPDVWLVTFTKG